MDCFDSWYIIHKFTSRSKCWINRN